MGQDGPPSDGRARPPIRDFVACVGVVDILGGRRFRGASRIAGIERQRRRDVLDDRGDAGQVDPIRRGRMKPR